MLHQHPFIHLRLHSAYSLAEGALKIKAIPKLCHEKGMPAVAITDTHNLFGALEFAIQCADNGIQPLIGCQLNITNKFFEDDIAKAKNSPENVVVLCQSEEGYKNLLKIISHSYLEQDGVSKPQITWETLFNHHQGLILLNGAKDSAVYSFLSTQQKEKAFHFLKEIKDIFGDRLYVEIQRHANDDPNIEASLLEIADNLDLPLVATNNCFFATKDMHKAHDALLCIAEGRYISETDRRQVTEHHYFKSSEEMASLFADLPEAFLNAALIAKRCHFMPRSIKPILPSFPTTEGRSEKEELRYQAAEGLKKRLSHLFEIPENYQQRLDYELSVIETMGFSGYFLIVADFIQYAKSQKIPVGPGRGSGAGSLVAWSLTITDMDPIRFGLIFERFLNPERVSMPDFDIDFCQYRRDEVIHYVQKRYGLHNVAHIITFGKLQARAVVRDVGRVLQMPYGQVDKISKLIPNNPANPITLKEALAIEPALKEAKENDENVSNLIDVGIQLEGLYRHASTHAAGVVIGDRPLFELVPLYLDAPGNVPATQFNMKYVEKAGLVKFDFLGLKTLTVIDKTCDLIRKSGIEIDISKIPLDDPKTFELLSRVETVGVFQLESGGMKDVVRKLRPDTFEDIIALVALYRPGPMDDIPRYTACKHGEEKITYLHASLEPILKHTYGVMVYQEQVMKIAQDLGGYTLGAADLLRRAMGKKIKEEMDAQRAIFVLGAVEKGIVEQIAHQIFDQMAKFAGYGFNKSHAAPYALLSYQTAYLKANYPKEFFAASMTLDMQNADKLAAFRQELHHMKIPLLPPDINSSYADFSVEGDGVRYGLAALKNVGHAAMMDMVAEREKGGKFSSLQDFLDRFHHFSINKRQLENLIGAGVFDSIEPDRALLMHNLEGILKYCQDQKSEKNSSQASLFGLMSNIKNGFEFNQCEPWGLLEKLHYEFTALSFFLSSHPLEIYSNLDKLGSTDSILIPSFTDGTSLKLVGVVLSKIERTSKNSGQKYAFLQMSDTTGIFEVAVFSEVFQKSRDILTPGTALFIQATIRYDGETYRLIASQVTPLEESLKYVMRHSRIHINENIQKDMLFRILKNLESGPMPLSINIVFKDLPCARIDLPFRVLMTPEARSKLLAVKGVIKIENF